MTFQFGEDNGKTEQILKGCVWKHKYWANISHYLLYLKEEQKQS